MVGSRLNQTIPGPASQRWSFGVGNPTHTYNNDGTYVYAVIDSADVPGYSHMNIRDNTITDALPIANFGFSPTLAVGKGCYNSVGSTCDTIIALDTSQIPVSSDQTIHSVELTLYVDQWDFSGGSFGLDLTIHQFLISNWNELGITWNTTGPTPDRFLVSIISLHRLTRNHILALIQKSPSRWRLTRWFLAMISYC